MIGWHRFLSSESHRWYLYTKGSVTLSVAMVHSHAF